MLRAPNRLLSRRLRFLHKATQQRKGSFLQDIQEQQLQDINTESLTATLQAHRTANLARKIRRVGSPQASRTRTVARNNRNIIPTNALNPYEYTPSETSATEEHSRPLSKTPEDASLHHGEIIHVLKEYQAPGTRPEELLERPWRVGTGEILGDRRQALHKDIESYANWVGLSKDEVRFRRSVVAELKKKLQLQYPDISIYAYGSLESAMSTPRSDIDIGFYLKSLVKDQSGRGPSPFRPQAVRAIHKLLDSIAQHLARSPEFGDVKLVLPTRRPLVHATFQGPLLQLQIVSSGPEQLDSLVHVRTYCAEFSQLRPLYHVVRAALTIRDLSEPRRGGLGSYQLTVLIGAFLKLRPRTSKESLATTLVDFLTWVADLNTNRYGVSVDPPSIFRKRSEDTVLSLQAKDDMMTDPRLLHRYRISVVDRDKPFALVLQDPTDLSHDVARSCYRIMDIRATFRRLAADVSRWLEHESTGRLAYPDAIIDTLLGNLPEQEQQRREISGSWATKYADCITFPTLVAGH